MIQKLRDLELKGKSVFIRLDFNVPLSDPNANGERSIEDDTRIREALPTIKMAMEKGAKVVLASHLGRPDGKKSTEFSLEPVAHHLAKALGMDVKLADDCIGDGIELLVKEMKDGHVLLLENLRFHKEEEKNDPLFSQKLARLCEVYVTDAFGTSHRKHASTYGVPSIVQTKAMGPLIEKELVAFDRILHNPDKPFYMILGGAKVTDKIKTIESLMRRVNGILIGGAMAHAFWKAQGKDIPADAKQPKPEDIVAAKQVLNEAKRRDLNVIVAPDTNQGFDIGTESIEKFKQTLANAKTIFWNGPLGWFEKPEYSQGTFELAHAIGKLNAFKVVGGGDTVSAIAQCNETANFTHLSTGGGAALEYLEGKGLPGIDILDIKKSK